MRNFTVIENKTVWQTDELMPLLNLAWDTCAQEPLKATPVRISIGYTRRSTYHWRWSSDGVVRITVRPPRPGQPSFPVSVGRMVRCVDHNELFVYLFTWAFAGLLANRQHVAALAWEALTEYRKNVQQVTERQVAAVAKREQCVGNQLAREVFEEMKRNSHEFKMSRLERLECAWLRKAKLAATKLRVIRRRKAALKAAQTRKQRQTQIVTV